MGVSAACEITGSNNNVNTKATNITLIPPNLKSILFSLLHFNRARARAPYFLVTFTVTVTTLETAPSKSVTV